MKRLTIKTDNAFFFSSNKAKSVGKKYNQSNPQIKSGTSKIQEFITILHQIIRANSRQRQLAIAMIVYLIRGLLRVERLSHCTNW